MWLFCYLRRVSTGLRTSAHTTQYHLTSLSRRDTQGSSCIQDCFTRPVYCPLSRTPVVLRPTLSRQLRSYQEMRLRRVCRATGLCVFQLFLQIALHKLIIRWLVRLRMFSVGRRARCPGRGGRMMLGESTITRRYGQSPMKKHTHERDRDTH
ncbi:uncharacterized protein EV420DRAFT_1082485 [Desarmillaria tabescens]|uniref:Uncharacterized protein n=1 Tax=Armillaria tabescens TaxID=1929756 RepID=A0AA39MQ71_ARMTA|nr:uncharacterized protein EV420DRAFT_1082485 [Desarmillaria tabescens]KAK0442009.1 hypothetical protein EV420DRAFT_1082485 [Desarmillaria tabescens]